VGRQAAAVGVTAVFSFLGTLAILKVVQATVGFRLTAEEQETGVDLLDHGEVAYAFRERSAARPRPSSETAELAALREQLVLEATAKVLEAVRIEPLRAEDDGASQPQD
jgi:hypothetical protein